MAATESHIVFNFFEKICKPPEQASYEDGMKFIYEYVKKQPSLVLGQLHKNLDPNGLYKYVNYVGFNNADFHVFQSGRPSAEWIEVVTKGLGGRDFQLCYPGGYAEVATTSTKPMCYTGVKDETSCYLLVNFKDTDVAESSHRAFEADWKTKTGADIITSALPSDIKGGDMALYKRRLPGRSPFVYLLRYEILPGASVENVLNFLPTLRKKLTAGGIPYSEAAAYNIYYSGSPV